MQDTTQAVAEPPAKDSFAALIGEMDSNVDTRVGTVLEALVVAHEGHWVSVDAGLKSRGRIPEEEFRNDEGDITVKEGDRVKVKVEQLDDGRGNTMLSHLQYRRDEAWARLLKAFDEEDTIDGVIRERIKGGYSVHIDGLRAFLPGSLVDLFPVKSESQLVGKRERFYVERLKHERMSAILNRRLVRERELTGGDLSNIEFKEGDVIKGTVAAVVDYPDFTAYLRVAEGIHGILRREDISWHRIGNVSDELSVDQELDVKVLRIDTERQQVTLGVKQLVPDPWDELATAHPPGSKTFAKVISVKEFGAFVEIEKGFEGLVHSSEMDWLQRNVQPIKVVQPGQEVEVMVLSYDKSSRRLSLGLKQCMPNPWEEFQLTYNKGSKVKGVVVGRQEEIGLFVELPGGINGLVHRRELSYTDRSGRDSMANYSNGQEIEVVVLNVNVEKRQVSLGIKQLERDPFERFRAAYQNRESIEGTVRKVMDRGATVQLSDEVTGFLPRSHVAEERVDSVSDKLAVGDKVKVQVIEVDKDRVTVSIKASTKSTDAAAFSKHRQRVEEEKRARDQSGSFGTVLKETLGGMGEDSSPEAPEADSEAKAGEGAADAKAGEGEPADADAADAAGGEEPPQADVPEPEAKADAAAAGEGDAAGTGEGSGDGAAGGGGEAPAPSEGKD